MSENTINNISIKQINKNKVYNFIYNEKQTCKSIITQSLQIGLSTVNQNLKILEEEKLIHKNGSFESTGGRKADALEIVSDARLSIGVALLKDFVYIVATNLYGEVIVSKKMACQFEHCKNYYSNLGYKVNFFIEEHDLRNILGVSIATQGIVSNCGEYVTYGKLLNNYKMKLSDFTQYIHYPCRLEHDAKAAGNLELWQNKQVTDGVVILLNHNLGGAIITNSQIQTGVNMKSGIIEHLSLNFDGMLCYCGKRGCLETYCSAENLEKASQMSIAEFFDLLEKGNTACSYIWEDYLRYLAMAIRNISVIVDGHYILSGHIASYIKPKHIEVLVHHIKQLTPFDFEVDNIILGYTGEFTQAIGASLHYIKEFLANV